MVSAYIRPLVELPEGLQRLFIAVITAPGEERFELMRFWVEWAVFPFAVTVHKLYRVRISATDGPFEAASITLPIALNGDR